MLHSYLRATTTCRTPATTTCRTRTILRHTPAAPAFFSTTDQRYPEDIQLDDIKPPTFYAEQGHQLNWFYYVDHQGRLFTEDTIPKNIATSLKAPKFIDFFFKQLRPNTEFPEFAEYPWYSPCGKEHNFIKASPSPVVFQELNVKEELVWGASLTVPFNPSKLRMDDAGMLYHGLDEIKRLRGNHGLIKSSLGVQLAATMEINVSAEEEEEDDRGDGREGRVVGTFEWKGVMHDVLAL